MKVRILAMILGLTALAVNPASAQWTGCGAGASAGLIFGELAPVGSPVGLGAQGQKAGVLLNCDYRMQAFVIGAEVNYDWYFGDLKTIGVSRELAILGRLGVLTSSANLLYGTAGWGQTESSFGQVNSWKIGLGDEFRIPNSPMYLDLRILYTRYDETDWHISSGARMDSLDGTARLKIKFGPGMWTGTGPLVVSDEAPAKKHCDPKMANC